MPFYSIHYLFLPLMSRSFFNLLVCFILFGFSSYAQDDWEDEEEEKKAHFFIGVNLGAYFANDNTAIVYRGSPDVTPFGIDYIFNLAAYQQTFNDYFLYPYQISEYPVESVYRTSFEIGAHLGVQFNEDISIYMDVNSTQLSYEQLFTVSIDDPFNQMIGPTFQQLPIFGKETRFNLNLGTQLSLYDDESANIYFSFFGNMNAVRLEKNYIVVNNTNYAIFHTNDIGGNINQKPGGVGFGGGSGLGLKLKLNENLLADLNYNLYYTETNLTESVQSYDFHHGIGLRIIWIRSKSEDDW